MEQDITRLEDGYYWVTLGGSDPFIAELNKFSPQNWWTMRDDVYLTRGDPDMVVLAAVEPLHDGDRLKDLEPMPGMNARAFVEECRQQHGSFIFWLVKIIDILAPRPPDYRVRH